MHIQAWGIRSHQPDTAEQRYRRPEQAPLAANVVAMPGPQQGMSLLLEARKATTAKVTMDRGMILVAIMMLWLMTTTTLTLLRLRMLLLLMMMVMLLVMMRPTVLMMVATMLVLVMVNIIRTISSA